MPPPPLSVVMPVRNAGATVDRAVHSVLASTFADFEFIIVDDGSIDTSAAVVEALGDPRIRLFRRPAEGIVAALNFGLAQCRGEHIARMDADDFSYPERFARQLAVLHQTTATIVGGRVRIVDAAGAPVASWQRYERWINEHLDAVSIRALRFVESPLVNPSTMASRAVYEAGFREGDFPEDYDFWLRAFAAGHQAVKVPEVVLDWTDGETRLTRTHPRYSAEAFDRCRREHLLACPLRGVKQVDLWGAGQTGKPWLRWLQETGFEVRRLVDVAPAKIGELIHGVKVIEPGALPPPDGTPMIVAVGAEGARELITAHLEPLGYRIGKEVWFVA